MGALGTVVHCFTLEKLLSVRFCEQLYCFIHIKVIALKIQTSTGDITDILCMLQVLSACDWNECFSTFWREDVHVCVCVCVWVHVHVWFESPVSETYTLDFQIFLKKYQHPLWMNLLHIIGFDRHFCLCNLKHRLSVRKTEERFVVGLFDFKNWINWFCLVWQPYR